MKRMDNFISKAAETVTIKQDRYEQLLDTVTRVDVAVQLICDVDFFNKESLLRILGTERAIECADNMRREEEERLRKYREQHGYDE